MAVLIQGTETHNKGAHLMLEAIVDRLDNKVRLTAPPQNTEYLVRARLGLYQTFFVPFAPIASTRLGNLIPKRFQNHYGFVTGNDLTGVLDASGFQFADAFKLRAIQRKAQITKYRARMGITTIMLPQAVGPFHVEEKKQWSKLMFESTSRIFVRDEVSAAYLDDLSISTPFSVSPDFTIGIEPAVIESITSSPFVAIVPNMKMITTGVLSEVDYIALLSQYGEAAKTAGLGVVVVVHEGGDLNISESLAARINAEIFKSPEPRVLKAALGQSEMVISSRFHAVVGGLSQSIPTIALGWSHKYKELMRDFGVPDWLANVDTEPEAHLKSVLGDTMGHRHMEEHKQLLINKNESMWKETEELLGI